MATVSDIEDTPLSGLNHIDALLDRGPDWNFLTGGAVNTILYTFSIASGNEADTSGQSAFSLSQQTHARAAFSMISALTGIRFLETSNGASADVHLAAMDLSGSTTSGLCSWASTYGYSGTSLTSYSVDAYVYLDNAEFGVANSNLNPGGGGYETLLHELGHMLGLKHPFEGSPTLPFGQDNTANTLMSYRQNGNDYAAYNSYDLAALDWLYGRDGLRGALGIGSSTGARYITGSANAENLVGTSFNDMLRGQGGNDTIDGGLGIDTVGYSDVRSAYTVTTTGDGRVSVNGAGSFDLLRSIEFLQFSDTRISLSGTGDTSAPSAPALSTLKNINGYVTGNTPLIAGTGEANATIKIYSGTSLIASGLANSNGAYSLTSLALSDGNYSAYATATDAAGNVSQPSATLNFSVDANAPVAPTASVAKDGAGVVAGSQALFTGTGEFGTLINLSSLSGGVSSVIATTQVGGSGVWSVISTFLADGNYSVTALSVDAAGNTSAAAAPVTFTVATASASNGTAANDVLTGGAGNNFIDGKGGIDTALYSGVRSGYTVAKSGTGFTVNAGSGAEGVDTLVNVERLKFSNASLALDIEGNGGQAYRVYKAAFDRTPDLPGVGYWIKQLDAGQTLKQVAAGFLTSNEFTTLYGAGATDLTFVTKLYANVLHRSPDGAGFDYWLNILTTQQASRSDVLVYFSESGENQVQVLPQIQNGFEYTPWLA